jgi:hypothetical protein
MANKEADFLTTESLFPLLTSAHKGQSFARADEVNATATRALTGRGNKNGFQELYECWQKLSLP